MSDDQRNLSARGFRCPIERCEGLNADGSCPNGYGITCEMVLPNPTNLDPKRGKPELRDCANASRHVGHLWMWDGGAMWCNGR